MTQPTDTQPARDDLYDALDQSWYRWDPPTMAKGTGIIHLIDAHAAEVRAATLRETADAARSELLQDDTGTPEDEAYNQGVRDAVAAIERRMAEENR